MLLIALLKLVNFRHEGLHSFEFALILRTNDFLESPLNHEIVGVIPRLRALEYTGNASEARDDGPENEEFGEYQQRPEFLM